MDEDKIKNLKPYFDQLPKRVQSFILSDEYEHILFDIAKSNNLTVGQLNILQIYTTGVLLGVIPTEEFGEELKRDLEIDKAIIEKIIKSVKEKIFDELEVEIGIVNNDIKVGGKLDPRITNLPSNIESIIEDSEYQNSLYQIAKSRKFTMTQMEALDTLTTDLIVGQLDPKQFQVALGKKLGISSEEAKMLVDDINTQIFKKIREKLVAMTTGAPNKDKILNSLKEDELGRMQVEIESLKEHGIEIEEQVAPAQTQTKANPKSLEIKPDIHPMLAQKLSAPVTMPIKTNSYGWNNPPKVVKEETPKTVAPKKSGYDNGVDPYRTPIE